MFYSIDGVEKTEAEFRALFGDFTIHTLPQANPGWRVTKLLGTGYTAPASITHTLYYEGQVPAEGLKLCEHFKDAADNADAVPLNGLPAHIPAKSHEGTTDANGATGFGWGGGSYYWSPSSQHPDKPPDAVPYGPMAYWVPRECSEVLEGVGMLHRTAHQHFDVVWEYGLGEAPPDPPEEPDEDIPTVIAELPSLGYETPTEVPPAMLTELYGPVDVWLPERPCYELSLIRMFEAADENTRLLPFIARVIKDGVAQEGVEFRCVCDVEPRTAVTDQFGYARFEEMPLYSACNKGPCAAGPGPANGIEGIGTVKNESGPNRSLICEWVWKEDTTPPPDDALDEIIAMLQTVLINQGNLEAGLAEHEVKLAEHDERVQEIGPAVDRIIEILEEMQDG